MYNTEHITLAYINLTHDDCDGCGEWITLDVPEDVLIGGECPHCGYYTTRYQPGMEPI